VINSAKGLFGLIAAVVGVIASVIGIMVGIQQLRGGGSPEGNAAATSESAQAGSGEEAGSTSAAAQPESAWNSENPGADLVLSTVEDSAGECQYLHVDFDAAFEGAVQPAASSDLHPEATDDLIWNPCENTGSTTMATLVSAGTTVGAALDNASPSPEECMDAVTAAGGANAALNIDYKAMDSGMTGLSAGTSLCVWNPDTSRLTIATSEGMEQDETYEYVIQYWVTTYLQE
jgi:hypothetical protein